MSPSSLARLPLRAAGTATHLAAQATGGALDAARHPVATTTQAVGLARGVIGTGLATGLGLVHALRRDDRHDGALTDPATAPPEPAGDPAPAVSVPAVDETPAAEREPEVVLREPGPPAEPPIDVVGQALAAEAAAEVDGPIIGAGRETEPHPVTREEEHGGAPFTRAELDEIADETEEGLGGRQQDLR